nr:MAG TPA: hypothetical protein [Caudoviricetes sp.]
MGCSNDRYFLKICVLIQLIRFLIRKNGLNRKKKPLKSKD